MLSFGFFPLGWLFGYAALQYLWPWLIGFLAATRPRIWLLTTLLVMGVGASLANTKEMPAFSWATFSVMSVVVLSLINTSDVTISKPLQKVLDKLGEWSYPLYLFHFPLYIFLHRYLAVRNQWAFVAGTFLICIVLNQVLDHWLKRVFWKPAVNWLTQKFQRMRFAGVGE